MLEKHRLQRLVHTFVTEQNFHIHPFRPSIVMASAKTFSALIFPGIQDLLLCVWKPPPPKLYQTISTKNAAKTTQVTKRGGVARIARQQNTHHKTSPPLPSPNPKLGTSLGFGLLLFFLFSSWREGAAPCLCSSTTCWWIRWWNKPRRRLLQWRPYWWRRCSVSHTVWHRFEKRTLRRGPISDRIWHSFDGLSFNIHLCLTLQSHTRFAFSGTCGSTHCPSQYFLLLYLPHPPAANC